MAEVVGGYVKQSPDEEGGLKVVRGPNWACTLLSGLKELYSQSAMFDVQLCDNDNMQLWAHGIVLAAACPAMTHIFTQNKVAPPRSLVYQNITIDIWKQIMDFIYLGQVTVHESTIHVLLDAANSLGMTDLIEGIHRSLGSDGHQVVHFPPQLTTSSPQKHHQQIILKPPRNRTKKRNMLKHVPLTEHMQIEDFLEKSETLDSVKLISSKIKAEVVTDNEEEPGDSDAAEEDVENNEVEGGDAQPARIYRCTLCNKEVAYGNALIRHELRHKMMPTMNKKKHTEGQYECKAEKCKKRFMTENARNCHMRMHEKKALFSCKHCDFTCFFQFVLDKHLVQLHPDLEQELVNARIECDVKGCSKVFHSDAGLQTHLARKHGIKDETNKKPAERIECKICAKPVFWMKEHMKSVHPEEVGEVAGEYPCPEPGCNKVLKYSSTLKRHMYMHESSSVIKCMNCKKKFHHPNSLMSHLSSCKMIPEAERKLLKPPSANKKYARKEKTWTCDQCGKTFTNHRNYSYHMDAHAGLFKHQCTHCGKKFQNSIFFKDHLNRHYGHKPYRCEHCDHQSASKSDLKQHMRQHTGEKPYQCPICKRSFVHRSNCYAHARKAHNKEIAGNKELRELCKVEGAGDTAVQLSSQSIIDMTDGNHQLEAIEIPAEMAEGMLKVNTGEQEEMEGEEGQIIVMSQEELDAAGQDGGQQVQYLLSNDDNELVLQPGGEGLQQYQTEDGHTFVIQSDSGTGSMNQIALSQFYGSDAQIIDGNVVVAADGGGNEVYAMQQEDGQQILVQQNENGEYVYATQQ